MPTRLSRRVTVASGLLTAALCLACPRPAAAVVINTATAGTLNSTAPANDPGWDNVGYFGIGTAIYLGDRWGLTAYHNLGSPNLVLGETSYALVPGSEVRLTNANQVVAVSRFAGQGSDDAVFGDHTFYADISVYQPQIAAIMVPEPAMPLLVLTSLIAAASLASRFTPPRPGRSPRPTPRQPADAAAARVRARRAPVP